MNRTTKYLRQGAVAVFAIGIAGFIAEYALNVLLTRVLDPHAYGDFKVARAAALFFGSAVLLGGDRACPKALAEPLATGAHAKAWSYLRFYLRVGLGLSLLVIAGVWLGSLLHLGLTGASEHHAVAWIIVTVPLLAVGAIASRVLQSARHPVLATLPWRVALPLVKISGLLALAMMMSRSVSLSDVMLLAIVAVCVITFWQWSAAQRLVLPKAPPPLPAPTPRPWLAVSMPMMGFYLMTLAMNQSDLYFMELLGDDHEVGFYAAAETTAHILLLIQTSIVGLIAPLIQPAITAGGQAERHTRRQGQRLLLIALVPVAALLMLAARPILAVFGPLYTQAAPELILLLIGKLAWTSAALYGLWLQYTGRGLVVVKIAIATLVADSLLNLVLIPTYGMTGAAASSALTLCAASAAIVIACRRLPVPTATA